MGDGGSSADGEEVPSGDGADSGRASLGATVSLPSSTVDHAPKKGEQKALTRRRRIAYSRRGKMSAVLTCGHGHFDGQGVHRSHMDGVATLVLGGIESGVGARDELFERKMSTV